LFERFGHLYEDKVSLLGVSRSSYLGLANLSNVLRLNDAKVALKHGQGVSQGLIVTYIDLGLALPNQCQASADGLAEHFSQLFAKSFPTIIPTENERPYDIAVILNDPGHTVFHFPFFFPSFKECP
jgi:hypothetical protein